MRRVSVVGSSGSGKSTIGRELAAHLGVPFVELDGIRHQAGWVELPDVEFVRRAADISAGDTWVIDGNYSMAVRDGPVWQRADTVLWLDLPRWRVMWQMTTRTLVRAVRRRELWNGNRERLRDAFSWDPERSMIRWAWISHAPLRAAYEQRLAIDEPLPYAVVRLRSRREITTWLARIDQADGA